MTDKIIKLMLEDYKQTIERLQKESAEITDMNIKLISRVKELEEYKASKQSSYEAMQIKNNNLEWENRELEKKIKELEEKLKWYDHYKDSALELKEKCNEKIDENNQLKAQVETFSNLMNVYKDISKGREDNKTVTDYISKLECKLNIAEKALKYYADGEDIGEAKIQGSDAWIYVVDNNYTDIAEQALQKMEEVK